MLAGRLRGGSDGLKNEAWSREKAQKGAAAATDHSQQQQAGGGLGDGDAVGSGETVRSVWWCCGLLRTRGYIPWYLVRIMAFPVVRCQSVRR